MILEIFLTLPINKSFYYLDRNSSYKKKVIIGDIVEVNFRNKNIIGVVWRIIPKKKFHKEIKEINQSFQHINLGKELIQSLEFMSSYSCNPIPVILKLFLSGLNIKYFGDYKKKQQAINCESVFKKNQKKLSLTQEQQGAIKTIKKSNKGFNVVVLDGVTSSGKTRVYMHAIKDTIINGLQCVILVPEKILTKQWIKEISKDFDLSPEIFHSSIPQKKRNEIWLDVLNKQSQLIIGTRSALFLPFQNLGLIVIDEEHDASFKQDEGTIINVRDLGIVRAKYSNSQIILSSATPSIETIFNCEKKKYLKISLKKRVKKSLLPRIKTIDLKLENKKENFWISAELKEEISKTIKERKQSLIFLNKRGYAPVVICKSCGFSKVCSNCDFPLVLHKNYACENSNFLVCHYCNYKEIFENFCKKCNSKDKFLTIGPGVEKIYEEVKEIFPNAKICLLSSDIAKKENDWSNTLNSIVENSVDIIIGTQIISKGHHFPFLKTVGILNIDNLLNSFDMRASEKAYQTITQVAGRAGREGTQGKVIIQTFQPDHPVIKSIKDRKKDEFLEWELNQRKINCHPPFSNLISLIIVGKNERTVQSNSSDLSDLIKKKFKDIDVFGPAPALLRKIRGNYRWRILIKISKNFLTQKNLKEFLVNIPTKKEVNLKIDVDPINFF